MRHICVTAGCQGHVGGVSAVRAHIFMQNNMCAMTECI